ncbi:MAG: DUF935 family protein [Nitrospiraceae bacterium]|nr:DUF935 family protein [Nitrospiraceae bacterium]
MPDDPETGTPEITTDANQAAIVAAALEEPSIRPDAATKPIVDVEVGSQISDPWWAYYTGKILLNPDKTLRTEGLQNTELYEDLLRDALVRSNLQTRRLAVIGKEWDITPGGDRRQDQKIADYVERVLLNFDFDAARYALLQGILTGFKVSEVMWEYSEGDVWIKEMIAKPCRRWSFGLKRELRMLTRANTFEGSPVPDRKFQVFRSVSDNGSPYGDGLGSALYWLVWFKKNAIKFWMVFSEKFGSPTAVGTYPAGTTKEQQDALLQALAAVQQEAAIKIPESMKISLLEAQRSGSLANYEMLCSFFNQEITTLIMGQTLTTASGHSGRSGSGGQAAAQTHEEVREDYLKADADLLSNQLNNQLIRWLVDFNFPAVKNYPKFWIRTAQEADLKPLADRDAVIQKMGLRFPASYLYETYGIPQPEEGDEIATPLPASQGAQVSTAGAFRECKCGHHEFAGPKSPDWHAEYMEMISPMLTKLTREGVGKVETWLAQQQEPPTLEDFQANVKRTLGESYSAIDAAAIGGMVQQIYEWHKLTDLLAVPSVEIGFGGADVRSVDFLSSLDHFYLSKFIDNSDAERSMLNFLKERYLEGGEGLFGRGDPHAVTEFVSRLKSHMIKVSNGQADRIIDTAVQRIRNWGHISQMHDMGLPEAEIYEPTAECPFCEEMNGKVLSVKDAYANMQNQAGMTPEAYQQFLKNRGQAIVDNIQDFIDRSEAPPYHPFCHGTITARFGA